MKIRKKTCLIGVLIGVLILIVLAVCSYVVMLDVVKRRCERERAHWAAQGIYFTLVTRESENRYQEHYVGNHQSFLSTSPDERVYWTKDCREDASRSAIAVHESEMWIRFNGTGVKCELRTITP